MSGRRSPLAGQLLRFAGIGALGTLAYVVVYVGLRHWASPDTASALARIGVATPTTWLNGRVTFARRTSAWRLHTGTALLLGIGTVITWAALAVEAAVVAGPSGLSEVLTVTLANVVAAAVRFVVLRVWVFPVADVHPRRLPVHRGRRPSAATICTPNV